MRLFVENMPLRCAQVFRPLLFQMDQCPLPGAIGIVLQARQLEPLLFGIAHTMRVQVTPSGISPTVTV